MFLGCQMRMMEDGMVDGRIFIALGMVIVGGEV